MRPGLIASLFGGSAPPPTGILRVVGTTNHVENSMTNRATTDYVSYVPVDIGSGDVSTLRLSFRNWYVNSTNVITNNANSVSIQKCSLQYNGVNVPVLFSGGRTLTLAPGDNDIQSDAVLATEFGVASLPRGARLWCKLRVSGMTVGNTIPTNTRAQSGGLQSLYFSSASTTMSDVDTLGSFTYTGTAPQSRVNVMTPWVLGLFTSGDPITRIHQGDSISRALGDTGTNLYGDGWFQLAAAQADYSQPVATINMGVDGTSATVATAAQLTYYFRYATRGSFFYGTNDFGTSGTGATVAVMQARVNAIITAMRNSGAGSAIQKIAVGKLLPKATSTDLWATEANQTTSTGWASGDLPDQYNAWLDTINGSTIDGVFQFGSVRGVDPFKWAVNGTPNWAAYDLTHPAHNGHVLMAGDARATFSAMN